MTSSTKRNLEAMVKMTGDTACIAPPFISEKSHIDRMAEGLRNVFGKY